ncbi:MAG: UDP-N-acetylmuramyl-tripeptide synthetase, partial [Verrucomicrobia bacterium]|nr:UDP-N-acetylmuramyl-tripeptide synthetase [Verrucomicrobiota bacterium]
MTNSDGMELAKLIGRLEDPTVIGPTDREIQAVAYDSRQVGPGSLFVAIRGNKSDGHDFIEQAVSRGAVAVVSERAALTARATNIVVRDSRAALSRIATAFFQNPSRRLRMIGVTGTNGKTTTTFLIKHLLERSGQRTALLGTVAYEIGDRVLPAPRTTPESLDLQQLLAECVQAGCQCVSMEVSSHALALERVEDIEFDAAVFTNLTQDHLDFHGSMKTYFEAKSRLFEKLRRSQDREAAGI